MVKKLIGMNKMKQENCILGLYAQTSIHAGTGQDTGIIKLPIQREGHNGYPCVFGSAMKGALRTQAETSYGEKDEKVTLTFGPASSNENANDHAGAVMISDARIFLMPVRSLTSQFKWVTCPAILTRYQQDASRFGIDVNFKIPTVPDPKKDEEAVALVAKESDEDSLFLEEYRFNTNQTDLSSIITELEKLISSKGDTQKNLQKQLVIVSNDMFSHICQHATPVNAHIAIDSTTGVVKPGALWHEETLPPETLLYVGVSANASRDKKQTQTASEILSNITNIFTEIPWLQVGGNETVGMGWCAVKTLKGA